MILTFCFSSAAAVSRIAACSICVVMSILGCCGVAVSKVPWRASAFDSVPPEVKMRCLGRQSSRFATCARAISSRWRADWPKRWREEGLPQQFVWVSCMAWMTSGWGCVVALLSK